MRPHFSALVGLLAASFVAARASSAADCDARAATCIDAEALWPTPGPSTFFSVGSAITTAPRRFGFGLATSVQRSPIVLRTSDSGPAGSVDVPAIGTQVTTSFLFSYGITERLAAALAAPVTFYQNGTGVSRVTGQTTEIGSTAVRDVRLGLGYALVALPRVGRPRGVGVVARFDLGIPTGDRDGFGGDRGLVGVPGVALEDRLGGWIFGATLGARLRKTTTLLGAPVGSQASLALGLGRALDRDEKLVVTGEAFGLPALVAGGASPYQWLLGVKWAPLLAGDFFLHLGGGGTMRFAGRSPIAEPLWRAVLDVRYEPLARDSDGDGVLDRDDRCPDAPEDRDGFHDDDGCPDPDNDGDQIPDKADRCPDSAEDYEGYEDTDGCPESDRDGDGVKDAVDKCPDQPEDLEGYEDTDGCPEGGPPKTPPTKCADGTWSKPGETCDSDRDGVLDGVDGCPLAAEDLDGIVDDDGCPEKDADEDGVGDQADRCPLLAETIDGVDDADGCPEEGHRSRVTFAAGAIELEKPARFAIGASKATKAIDAQIPLIAQRLQGLVDRGVEKIVIEAWADTAGESNANEALATRRAEAIRAALVAVGIPDGLIKATAGDLADPPPKDRANWLVTVRTKRKAPLSKLPDAPAPTKEPAP